jgi:hypothetical protein
MSTWRIVAPDRQLNRRSTPTSEAGRIAHLSAVSLVRDFLEVAGTDDNQSLR